jgi:endothelin-converting enzyme/putative endopeptidase
LCRIAANAGQAPADPFLSASQKGYNRKLLILLTLSEVNMRRWFLAFLCLVCFSFAVSAQVKSVNDPDQGATSSATKPGAAELPKLEKFDPSIIDKTKNACTDFYQYTCSNWLAAHPIKPDLPVTSTALPLFLYNQTILRNALDTAAADKQATGSERQIGDWWESCTDETVRNANGKAWLQPALNTIASLKSSKDLPRVLAYLHTNFPAAWQMWNDDDNFTRAPLFGFGPAQDLADASKMVAGVDQGGMGLPSLEFYLDNNDRFKEIRAKYVQHIQKMFELAGDPPDKAAAPAKTVMEIETALAKASMDNVTRRDPKAIYNKRSLQELKAAVPDFGWDEYLQLMGAPSVPF